MKYKIVWTLVLGLSLASVAHSQTDGAITPGPNQAVVYVANLGTDIAELKASDNVVFARAAFRHGSNGGILITPNGRRMYVSDHETSSVTVYDTATNVPVTDIQVGLNPIGLAVTPNGAYVYVANQNSNSVSVIATATNSVIRTIPVGLGPIWVTLSRDGSRAYVSNQDEASLSIISTASNQVTKTVPIGYLPFQSAFAPDGRHLWVSVQGEGVVRVFDTDTNTSVADIPAGNIPRGIAFTPDGARAYVANFGSNVVAVLDVVDQTFLEYVTVGVSPWGIAMTSQGQAYVANFGDSTVSVIDTATNTVTSVPMYRQAVDVAVSTRARPAILNYTFQLFDYPGATRTEIWAINDLGTVVGDYTDSTGIVHGFLRFTNGGFSTFDVAGAVLTQILGINNRGVVVGDYVDSNGLGHGFQRTPNGTVTTIDYPGAPNSAANGINNHGDIVGAYGDQFTTTGFLLRERVYSSFEDPNAAPMQTAPYNLNDFELISGSFTDTAGSDHGFLLRGTHYTTVDFPMADNTDGYGDNDLGQLVGIYNSSGPNHGFLFDSVRSRFLSFDAPDVAASQVHGINNRGQITGNYRPFTDNSRHGFIATPHAAQP